MTSQASLSLYHSQKSLTHNIGSASALPIIFEVLYTGKPVVLAWFRNVHDHIQADIICSPDVAEILSLNP